MLGELDPASRPKTRSRNKLILNMNKLLNPSLNIKGVTITDDNSADEESKIDKVSTRRKEAVVKISALHPEKRKNPLQSAEDSSQPEPKLSAIFLELRNELLKQQQGKEIEVSYDEDQLLIDEAIPKK